MKDILTTLSKIMGLVFAAGVIAFTGWMTMRLGQRLIPGDTIMQWMILILFDVAAVIWFFQFIAHARGTAQWALAALGWVIGLAGAIIMTAGELILGQQLVVIDDPTRFGWLIIATVVIAALSHAILIYLFHFSDPAMRNRIEMAQKTSKAIETAYNAARQQIDNNIDALTAGLVQSAIHEAQMQINEVTAYHVRNAARLEAKAGETARGGDVIEGQAEDIDERAELYSETIQNLDRMIAIEQAKIDAQKPKKKRWVFSPGWKGARKPNGNTQSLHSETTAINPTQPPK